MAICIKMGKIWQPLLVTEGFELINSLISGTNRMMLQDSKLVRNFAISNIQHRNRLMVGFCGGMGIGLLPKKERSLLLINLTG